MWCPEGFYTLSEIMEHFGWSVSLVSPAEDRPPLVGPHQVFNAGLDLVEAEAFENWLLAVFLHEFRDSLRVCLPSGAVIKVDRIAFAWFSPSGYHHYDHFLDGFPSQYEERALIAKWRFPYLGGPQGGIIREDQNAPDNLLWRLSGFPVCIAEKDLPTQLDGLARWLLSELPRMAEQHADGVPPSWSSKDLAQQIVDAYRAGVVKKKAEAQRRFGRGLVTDAWLALFQEAAQIDPSISKPGRRKRQKPKP